jgi:glyoxylase-like metal-dependent hydrolase (beta-lactamase superfamily II)
MTDVRTIDCHYLGEPQHSAAYLLVEGDRAAFIENNTAHAVPRMLQTLREAGLGPEQVDYVIITHVHLDHAGGSSALMNTCPNATLLAHPRAARHVIDPSKLVASAKQVYGEETFEKLYGTIEPVPGERVRTLEDGEKLAFGFRELTFFYTRGHANHHFCIHDSGTNGIFTGDAFGLLYPALQRQGVFAFPSTSPTDFHADEAKRAVRRIAEWGADRVFPTHFGEHTAIQEASQQLLSHLEFAGELEQECLQSDLPDEQLEPHCKRRWHEHMKQVLSQHGDLAEDPEAWRLLELDLDLNAQGIAFVVQKARRKARQASSAS